MGDGVQFRSPYNYDVDAASSECAIAPGGPSLTVQSMTEDTDLNLMLKRFKVTGQMPATLRLPSYADFSGITDFRSALDAIRDAEDNFMEIPPEIRSRFENDPQLLLDFVSNPANIGEVKKLFGEENVRVLGSDSKASAGAGDAPRGAGGAGAGGAAGDAGGGKPADAGSGGKAQSA